MADLTQTVRVGSQVMFRDLGGESVLLDLDGGRYFGLDEVGTRIFQLISENGRLEAVHERLGAEYEAPADRLLEDLLTFVESLIDAQLVELDPA